MSAIGIARVKGRKASKRLFVDLLSRLRNETSEICLESRCVVDHGAIKRYCDRIEIAGENIASNSKAFNRNCTTTSEWVKGQRISIARSFQLLLCGSSNSPCRFTERRI
jgi:hypothetical protein